MKIKIVKTGTTLDKIGVYNAEIGELIEGVKGFKVDCDTDGSLATIIFSDFDMDMEFEEKIGIDYLEDKTKGAKSD